MMNISLASAARLSKLVVKDFNAGASVDITYNDDSRILAGTYKWDEVKQFVRELAEALDMTLEEPTPEVEPIVLPKDVYEEVKEMREGVVSSSNPKSAADYKLWDKCSSPKDSNVVSDWINNTSGATIDLAKMLMGELPFKCEKSSWVLTVQSGNYLSKAYINDTGGWSLEYSRDIKEAIKFSSYVAAVKLEATVSHVSTLEIEEV